MNPVFTNLKRPGPPGLNSVRVWGVVALVLAVNALTLLVSHPSIGEVILLLIDVVLAVAIGYDVYRDQPTVPPVPPGPAA